MIESRLVDTNVLIVASAADPHSPFHADATPVQDPALRQQVFDWLEAFERDPSRHAVLDYGWHICGEYEHKLAEQDYGWLAMMHKMDKNEVVWVDLQMDGDGNAVLPASLQPHVTDLADRKMVAAALAVLQSGGACKLSNASDTDWLDCQQALRCVGLEVENLLQDWLVQRWHTKHGKKAHYD